MNTATAAAKSQLMSETSTSVLVEALTRLSSIKAPTSDETRALRWTVEELVTRHPEAMVTLTAAL